MSAGLVLNGVWEVLQSPLYADWPREWSYLLWTRLHCTVGDVMILLFSFWGVSLLYGTRSWIGTRRAGPVVLFLTLGLAYTIWSEWFNTGIRAGWEYAPTMPVIAGIGATPLAQWVVIPLLLVWSFRSVARSPDE